MPQPVSCSAANRSYVTPPPADPGLPQDGSGQRDASGLPEQAAGVPPQRNRPNRTRPGAFSCTRTRLLCRPVLLAGYVAFAYQGASQKAPLARYSDQKPGRVSRDCRGGEREGGRTGRCERVHSERVAAQAAAGAALLVAPMLPLAIIGSHSMHGRDPLEQFRPPAPATQTGN